jgi:hypothetical protein
MDKPSWTSVVAVLVDVTAELAARVATTTTTASLRTTRIRRGAAERSRPKAALSAPRRIVSVSRS